MHVDPEFSTFTYGDPTPPKRGLKRAGDLLVFYAGVQGWGWTQEAALYLVGYFEVAQVGFATELDEEAVQRDFAANFHVRHVSVYQEGMAGLRLVDGA